jgi:HmuY protein
LDSFGAYRYFLSILPNWLSTICNLLKKELMKTVIFLFKSLLRCLICLGFMASFYSCSNNDPASVALTAIIYKNLNADYAPVALNPSGLQIRPKQTNKFTFFSFKTGTLVAHADSATTKWDVGFRGPTIIVNGGSSGKGTGKAQVLNGIFDEIATAPEDGYVADSQADNKKPVPTSYAISTEAGKGWYNLDPATGLLSPIESRVLVFQTADGNYAKMEILSYYQDAPAAPTAATKDRFYTFRYVYQPNGNKSLQ